MKHSMTFASGLLFGALMLLGAAAAETNPVANAPVPPSALPNPVKLEIFDRVSGQTATTHIDWGRDLEIADSFFEPDPRVTLERISYEEYKTRAQKGPVGPVPALFSGLIHGG